MEKLDPDLIPRVRDGMIHHPLIIRPAATDASSINRYYRDKLAAVRKAEADGDWRLYVDLHERPHRIYALLAATNKGLKKTPSEFWAIVGSVWQDSESIYASLNTWKRLWASEIEGRRTCMSEKDICVFDSLPEQIELWRGTSHTSIGGLSWTLDQEKAIWFARRFCTNSRVPLVAKGTVAKGDVLAYFGERDEREIVSLRVLKISMA
jgi:hypothetical protein